MVSSYFINVGDHLSFHHCFDASTLYRKPRKDQCLDHIRSQFSKSSDAAVTCRPLGFVIQPTLSKSLGNTGLDVVCRSTKGFAALCHEASSKVP